LNFTPQIEHPKTGQNRSRCRQKKNLVNSGKPPATQKMPSKKGSAELPEDLGRLKTAVKKKGQPRRIALPKQTNKQTTTSPPI